jgi:peptidoglycan/LPS O-acetylase OafA/YrhL
MSQEQILRGPSWKISLKKTAVFLSPVLGIGFLRLLLALAVVFNHTKSIAGFGFISGPMAVQSFFILSGFYMALILTEKYQKYSTFIVNRLLRIFPLYFVVLVLTVFALALFPSISFSFHVYDWYVLNPFSVVILFLSHIFLLGQDLLFFIGVNTAGSLYLVGDFNQAPHLLGWALIMPQTWTLSLEIMFYLLAPFIVCLKKRQLLGLVIVAALLRVLLYATLPVPLYDQWTYRFFPAELIFFLVGVVSFRLYVKARNIDFPIRFLIIFSLALFVCVAFYTHLPLHGFLKQGIYFAMLAAGLPLLFAYSKMSVIDRYLGNLSYPMYLCHFLIIGILEPLHLVPEAWFSVIVVLAIIAVSIVLYHVCVQPVDLLRARIFRQSLVPKVKVASN